jgi:hypothetical protein
VTLEKRAFYILEAKGWRRPDDAWGSSNLERELDDGEHTGTLDLTDEGARLRVNRVLIDHGTLGALDPIAFSELVADVERARL